MAIYINESHICYSELCDVQVSMSTRAYVRVCLYCPLHQLTNCSKPDYLCNT